nr:ribonuclease H-like domain-containing protein [Tanacetum cinerariifolium]
MFSQFMKMNTASSSSSRTLSGNTITNPKEDLKGITTRIGTAYPGPTIPASSSSPVVERETEATKDMVHPTNNRSIEDVQPPVVPTKSLILNSEQVNSLIIEPVASPRDNPSHANQWDMCNSVVVTWILNSFRSDLFAGAVNAKTAFEMWNDLKETYDKFLMGLDESYLAIRSNLLTRKHLSSVKTAFIMISGEESHKNISYIWTTKPATTAFVAKTFDNNKKKFSNNNNHKGSGNSNSNNMEPNPNLKCTNCNKVGHTVDRCFEIFRYPAGFAKRNFNSNSRPVTSNNASADLHSNGVSSYNATTSNSLVSLSIEHLARPMNLLNENGISTANANMAGKQYNGLYLFDVDNACKIVSNSCIASCFTSKTLWHQRLGHPDQVLDALKTTLNLDSYSTSDHLCDTCNEAKQTRETFSLSNHKSTKIRELMHLDVWGPYKITSRDGFKYFLTIVDDYS